MTAGRCIHGLLVLCVLFALGLACAPSAHAAPVGLALPLEQFFTGGRERAPRGPVEFREEWALAQMRLTLPPTSPDPLPVGTRELRFVINRGSDFGWNQTQRGENPRIRRFLVDAEHQTTEVQLRTAVNRRWSLGMRIPVHYRGAGFMDGIIDWVHEVTGTATNFRESFFNDRYRIEGFLDDGRPFSLNDSKGWGVGNVEVNAHYAFVLPRNRCDWRAAVIGRVLLPTATGPFVTDSIDLGVQVVAAKRIANRLDLYGGLGATWFTNPDWGDITYAPVRGNGFLALEWQVNKCWSLIVDTWYTTRLVDNILRYQAAQWYLDFAAKIDLGKNMQLEVGFIENIENQQTTVDAGIHVGLRVRW